jgi:predicted N-acetyltransferase YhbS
MLETIIRNVLPEDYEDISELNMELGYSYPKEKVKARIEYILMNTRDIILVAEVEGKVIGFIHASPYELLFNDSLMNLLGFVVKQEHRGTGVGHRLITELESIAKKSGFSGIRLTSGSNRTEAHKFYNSHGYLFKKDQKNFTKYF